MIKGKIKSKYFVKLEINLEWKNVISMSFKLWGYVLLIFKLEILYVHKHRTLTLEKQKQQQQKQNLAQDSCYLFP